MKIGVSSREDLRQALVGLRPGQLVEFVFSTDEDGPKAAGQLRELLLSGAFYVVDDLLTTQLQLVALRGSWGSSKRFKSELVMPSRSLKPQRNSFPRSFGTGKAVSAALILTLSSRIELRLERRRRSQVEKETFE